MPFPTTSTLFLATSAMSVLSFTQPPLTFKLQVKQAEAGGQQLKHVSKQKPTGVHAECSWLTTRRCPDMLNSILNAIYQTEGGSYTHHPYGILHHGSLSAGEAREIAAVTVVHVWQHEHATKVDKWFIEKLANRYCPPQCDWQGNHNWKRNMELILQLNTATTKTK